MITVAPLQSDEANPRQKKPSEKKLDQEEEKGKDSKGQPSLEQLGKPNNHQQIYKHGEESS